MVFKIIVVGELDGVTQVDTWVAGGVVGALLVGADMWHETNPALRVVVDGVVTGVEGQSHDKEGDVILLVSRDEHEALRAIFAITDVHNVVLWAHLKPGLVEQEVEFGVCLVTRNKDADAVFLFLLNFFANFNEERSKVGFEK